MRTLEEVLRERLDEARAAWPELPLDEAALLARLATVVRDAEDPIDTVRQVSVAELHLAERCAHGVDAALALFDSRYFAPLSQQLRRRGVLPDASDEALQRLRLHLLLSDGDRPARITGYEGRGPLAAWLGVAAVRMAAAVARAAPPVQTADDLADRIASVDLDPELAYLKARYGQQMRAALRDAIAALSPRDANVLRLHVVDGVTGAALGRMYRVTRRTVHRWLEDIRAALLGDTRRLMAERAGVPPDEFESMVALVRSQIEVSIHPDGD